MPLRELAHFRSVEQVAAADLGHDAYMCFRPHIVAAQAEVFLSQFPGRVLYAVKCNPEDVVLRTLYTAGIRDFDVASLSEIDTVRRLLPKAGIYYHHPVKSRRAIHRAYHDYGVRHFMVDHESELEKLIAECGEDELTIGVRLATPAGDTSIHLSEKFGASPGEAAALLQDILRRGHRIGFAFHVGSLCRNPGNFEQSLQITHSIISKYKNNLAYVNVGGGFPAYYPNQSAPPLSDYFHTIRLGVAQLQLPKNCDVMCEPGRALVADSSSLLAQVLLRKGEQLHISEGLYGALADLHYSEDISHPVRIVRQSSARLASKHMLDFTIFGPTCDGIDKLPMHMTLPGDVAEGDWLEFDQLGAYSSSLASRFNGFGPPPYVQTDDMPFSRKIESACNPAARIGRNRKKTSILQP